VETANILSDNDMVTIYSQLRVSCGLSATINSLQPEETKASPTQTLALWLDTQWARLTNNNDPDNPLVKLAERREWKWAVVLDYILLRKIRSSFLLCQGIPAGVLVTELEDEHLNWDMLKPAFLKIISRLNNMKEDWPLWHYNGELEGLDQKWSDMDARKSAKKLVQSIKMFHEIFQSNIAAGPEAEWKNIFMNMSGFPEKVTPQHVLYHIDHYKTDFELSGLLESFGFEMDSSSGRAYPKNIAPNSIILINRPEHWVTESPRERGVVLDSLTQATDVIHSMDSFNYFKPKENLKVFRKAMGILEKIFPQIEVDIEQTDLTEFPDLELPETNNPVATAAEYHHRAVQKKTSGDVRNALLDKRVEVALLEKGEKNLHYYTNLLEFSEWCVENDKPGTCKDGLVKLEETERELGQVGVNLRIRRQKLEARLHNVSGDADLAVSALRIALDLFKESDQYEEAYEVANSLGVALARAKKPGDARAIFQRAKEFALKAAQKAQQQGKKPSVEHPMKYWPAIIRGLDNKIKSLPETNPTPPNKPEQPPAQKIE
jgi:tetratricopeptide (TPR) repeat protein